ncbi:MAG: hypothetical protein ACOVP4_13060 [Bacteriovoracaceae bacterium]
MKTGRRLSNATFILLFITIIFGIYSTQIVMAEQLPIDSTIPRNTPGLIREMRLPETIGEEIPAPKNTAPLNRGTSSIPEGKQPDCATVNDDLRCAPRVFEEPR